MCFTDGGRPGISVTRNKMCFKNDDPHLMFLRFVNGGHRDASANYLQKDVKKVEGMVKSISKDFKVTVVVLIV
jgi:hypothetical protein